MSNQIQTPSPPQRPSPMLSDAMRDRLIESRLTPNAISLAGLVGNLIAAALITQDLYVLAGLAFIAGSTLDLLDGHYSRMSGKATLYGAFLDSTLDRIEEGIVLAAIAAQLAADGDQLAVAAVVIAVLGSLMVSYTRARAEALGVACKVGIASRAVRIVIISAGLLFARGTGIFDIELLEPAIYLLAGLTAFTVMQRIFHVRRELRGLDAAAAVERA